MSVIAVNACDAGDACDSLIGTLVVLSSSFLAFFLFDDDDDNDDDSPARKFVTK